MAPIRSGPRLTQQDVAAEWSRRAQRDGLARGDRSFAALIALEPAS